MIDIKYADNRKVFNVHNEDIPYLSFSMLDSLGVPNMYTTRYKSESEKGLRVAYMNGEEVDEARIVIGNNLGKLAERLGSDSDHLGIGHQEHTANVIALGSKDLGYLRNISRAGAVDGLVTDATDACLVIYGADCPSIYIVDPGHHAIGLVHAGWKGTLGRIPAVAIKMMQEKYGSDPSDMYAAVGPSICEKCYEMGDEIYDRFALEWSTSDADELLKRHDSGKYHLDLWKANRMTLERAGIPEDHIEITNVCTCCNTETFYSYRAHKMENEQAALLVNRFD